MSVHEHLPPQARKELKEVGRTKGLKLAKVAGGDRQEFDCATWLHTASSPPKDQFKREVKRKLRGGNRNRGDYLPQAVQDPDSGGGTGD